MKCKNTSHRKILYLILEILGMSLISTCSITDRNLKNNVEPTVSQFTVLSVREHLPSALALAQAWHSDGYLLNLTVEVKLQRGIPNFEGINFEFRSPRNKKNFLSVFCKNTCSSEELTTTIELQQCPPLEVNDSLLESEEALELGLKNGGVDFINHESAYASMDLEWNYPKCEGSAITWEVRIGTYVPSEQKLFVFDAVTGELLEKR